MGFKKNTYNHELVADAYKLGLSYGSVGMVEIEGVYGISRERVRDVVSKNKDRKEIKEAHDAMRATYYEPIVELQNVLASTRVELEKRKKARNLKNHIKEAEIALLQKYPQK